MLEDPRKRTRTLSSVERVIGKAVNRDAENRDFFDGRIEAVNIEGWGFTRSGVKEPGTLAGTMMAPDPDRFITLGGEPYLIATASGVRNRQRK